MSKDNNSPLSAIDYAPLEGKRAKSAVRLSPTTIILILVASFTLAILFYQWLAKAVIFEIQPPQASVDISGLSFNIGDNYLLLEGDYQLSIAAPGYHASEQSITVTEQATQSFQFKLEPLPGNLNISSDLQDIEVTIDNQRQAMVPGLIQEISRGSHQFSFSKYRYFPLSQQIEITGLGQTQDINVSLLPAWGEMAFDSQPQQAELYVDGTFVGKTPISTEILETGSTIRLELAGYKTYQEQVMVKAGTSDKHPQINMIVADGKLRVTTEPNGASLMIDKQFIGTTPLTTELPPFKTYALELFKEGYLKATRTLSLQPLQATEVALSLKPNIGDIELTLNPSDVQIIVDGIPKGKGSRTLSLSAKPHQLTLKKSGYQSQTITITPRPEQAQALSIKLLTLEEAYWASRPLTIKTVAGSTLRLFKPNQSFTLGAPRRQAGRRANEVQKKVSLRRPFYMATTELSNQQYRRWRDHSSSAVRGKSLDMDSQPAVNLSWQDAALYCNWLSQQQGLPVFYKVVDGRVSGYNWESHGYRLPTEAEWAWAAKVEKNGDIRTFAWQSNLYPPDQVTDNYADQSSKGIISFSIANYNDGYSVSAPVGSFQANAKGLFNMSGNVSEWVNDYYDLTPNLAQSIEDPRGPASGNRYVIRGASWALGSRGELRLSARDAGNDGRPDVGFRIARYVDKPGAQP